MYINVRIRLKLINLEIRGMRKNIVLFNYYVDV